MEWTPGRWRSGWVFLWDRINVDGNLEELVI